MIDSNSYSNLQEVEQLCQTAAENGIKEKDSLGQILKQAAQRDLEQWDAQVRSTWEKGLEELFEGLDNRKELPAEDTRLLKAMLDLGFDSHIFRDGYIALAKTVFGKIYQNPVKLSEAMGFRDPAIDMQTLRRRWEMMSLLQIDTWIYEAVNGVGTIAAVDKVTGELKVVFARNRFITLAHYLNKTMAVRQGTKLHVMLKKHEIPQYSDKQSFLADMRASVLTLDNDLPLEDTVKRMLVPAVMTEEAYNQFSTGGATVQPQKIVKTQQGPSDDSRRWDNSRSIDELVSRLKDLKDIKVDNVNSENVTNILLQAAGREQQSELFAQAVAYIWHESEYQDNLREFFKEAAPKACIWNNSDLFLTVTDKLPGKLVAPWFEATKEAMGSAYLVDETVKLPYRLWGNVETLLKKNKSEQNLLSERVYRGFETGKVNSEMYFWLWKAPEDPRRTRFISDSYLLFKTLRVEVKGSYLKSQRTLHRMLVDDPAFQSQVMRNGDQEAVQALVRCVKHQPLLDAWERQSLLVKIVRLYPEAIHLVEEKTTATSRQFRVKLTSNRSYRRCQLELKHLVDVEIPENVAAIEYARSLGDLRENSEFKFAKEQQRLLSKRRGELEAMLDDTRPTDFRNVKVEDVAIPGCSVDITFEDGRIEEYFLLGRFDTIPERNMISYETPLGQKLSGTKVGSTLEMPSGENATLTAVKPLSEEMLTWLGETNIPENEVK